MKLRHKFASWQHVKRTKSQQGVLLKPIPCVKLCLSCNKEFERRRFPGGKLEARTVFLARDFCSNTCVAVFRTGKNIPRSGCAVGHALTDDNIYLEERQGLAPAVRCRKCKRKQWVKYNDLARKDVRKRRMAIMRSAKKRVDIEFDLLPEEVEAFIVQPCHWCGYAGENLRGLDRLDNRKGYTPDNIMASCFKCNSAKSDMSVDEFVSWLARASEHTLGL